MVFSRDELIARLDLKPHPEGGFYKEVYRSHGKVPRTCLGDNYSSDRNFATGIYFLLTSENFSAFHRINQDESWHFYYGSCVTMHVISPNGRYTHHRIGVDLTKEQEPQLVIPGRHWFAAEVSEPNSFALVGCTVAPGFHFDDFQLAKRKQLAQEFPNHRKMIERLTR